MCWGYRDRHLLIFTCSPDELLRVTDPSGTCGTPIASVVSGSDVAHVIRGRSLIATELPPKE